MVNNFNESMFGYCMEQMDEKGHLGAIMYTRRLNVSRLNHFTGREIVAVVF